MDILAEAVKLVRQELENKADRVERALVSATEEAMNEYYSVPEGKLYNRSGAFGKAYKHHQEKNTRDINNMKIVVSVEFEQPVDYPVKGVSAETIYDYNLQGYHGTADRPRSADVLEYVERAADLIAAK